jgi:hypothetical protein
VRVARSTVRRRWSAYFLLDTTQVNKHFVGQKEKSGRLSTQAADIDPVKDYLPGIGERGHCLLLLRIMDSFPNRRHSRIDTRRVVDSAHSHLQSLVPFVA